MAKALMWKAIKQNQQPNFAMTQCRQEVFEFQGHNGRKVTADFSGGYLSSDGGGAVLLRELELKLGLMYRLAGCFSDLRDQRYVDHKLPQLLRQRIGALALGYEDLNDHEGQKMTWELSGGKGPQTLTAYEKTIQYPHIK